MSSDSNTVAISPADLPPSEPRVTRAWGVETSGGPVVELVVTLPPLGDNEVEVKIAASGVCASDVDAFSGKYDARGFYKYPIIGGHEGVGRVVALGKNVTNLKINDRVGLGIYRYSCGSCSSCFHGVDNACSQKALMFALGKTGTFAEYVRINSRYAYPVPDGIPTQVAGPLFCAGGTVFSPFRVHNIRPGQHVGVVGIGGLGHLALKFARAWGCRVTALSRGTKKQEESKQLGAHHFVDLTDPESIKQLPKKIDFILLTASGPDVDYNKLITLLAPEGKLVIMGITSMKPEPISLVSLLLGCQAIVGSGGSSSGHYLDMLEFSALHSIAPQCEILPAAKIADAVNKVKTGDIRYRAVLVMDESLF